MLLAVSLLLSTALAAALVTPSPPPAPRALSGRLWEQYNASRIGLLELPRLPPDQLPSACLNFSAECALEAAGDFEPAFRAYEARYAQCGDAGWRTVGTAHGQTTEVVFKATPCGSKVVVKAGLTSRSDLNSVKDCRALKLLTAHGADAECPGCFPRYYYFSNITRACYTEFVPSARRFVTVVTPRSPHLKTLFLQALTAIRVLRRHNLEHFDLSARNMLVRPAEDGSLSRLMMIDFGLYHEVGVPLTTLQLKRVTGSRRRQDTFAVACRCV